MSMVRDSTRRRIERKFAKTDPDLQGFLPTDGISFTVGLVKDDSEDFLGLETPKDPLAAALAAEHPDSEPRRGGDS